MHPDMSKQSTARHDKAMRTVIQAFTKGHCGSHYLIAYIGKTKGLKDMGVHGKRVTGFVLPILYKQGAWTLSLLQGGAADVCRHAEQDEAGHDDSGMTTAEQQQHLRYDDISGPRLTPLTMVMPNGNLRCIKIEEGGYCPDTRYEEQLQENGAQHKALEEALKDYGTM